MLQVQLLGAVAAERDGEQLSLQLPVSRLLAFLAVRPGPHDRETVAGQLWSGSAAAAARANLRTAVWALRKATGDDALTGGWSESCSPSRSAATAPSSRTCSMAPPYICVPGCGCAWR